MGAEMCLRDGPSGERFPGLAGHRPDEFAFPGVTLFADFPRPILAEWEREASGPAGEADPSRSVKIVLTAVSYSPLPVPTNRVL